MFCKKCFIRYRESEWGAGARAVQLGPEARVPGQVAREHDITESDQLRKRIRDDGGPVQREDTAERSPEGQALVRAENTRANAPGTAAVRGDPAAVRDDLYGACTGTARPTARDSRDRGGARGRPRTQLDCAGEIEGGNASINPDGRSWCAEQYPVWLICWFFKQKIAVVSADVLCVVLADVLCVALYLFG